MTTLKRVRAWRLGKELNDGDFSLFKEPAVLHGCEHRPGGPLGVPPSGATAILKPWLWPVALSLS